MRSVCLLLILGLAACSEYGRRLEFNNGELFYSHAVRYNEAHLAGQLLMKNNMYFDGRPKSVQLDKKDGRYIFRVVEPEQPYITQPYENLAFLLNRNVFHAPVDVEICDNRFKPVRKIPFKDLSQE
jgi:hypothetical protein